MVATRPRPSGTRAHPRNHQRPRLKGSTAQRRLATSARSRSPLRRATTTTTTTTTDLMHPRKTDDGPSTQWTDLIQQKKFIASRPRPSGTREHPRNQDGRGSTARDISKVSTDHHDPDPTTKVGRNSPSPLGHPGAPTKSKTAEAQRLNDGSRAHQQGRALHCVERRPPPPPPPT